MGLGQENMALGFGGENKATTVLKSRTPGCRERVAMGSYLVLWMGIGNLP